MQETFDCGVMNKPHSTELECHTQVVLGLPGGWVWLQQKEANLTLQIE